MGAARVILASCLVLALSCANAALVNDDVNRNVNIETNMAQIVTDVTIRNAGSSSESSFDVYFPAAEGAHVADVGVFDGKNTLGVKRAGEDENGLKFTVTFASPLGADKTVRVSILASITHVLSPHPDTIDQTDNQLVVYFGNVHFYSPYTTKVLRTEVVLGTTSIEMYSPSDNVVAKGSSLSYGPYTNLPAFSELELVAHYQNNFPFMTVTSLVKEVEVSHWGHISFEEHVDMTHSGAKLKAGFSRLDFQRKPAPSHFRQLVAHLPATADGIYYRDVIGNISTSRTRVETPEEGPAFTNLELLPRYLMFGGWKTAFYFGYSVGLNEFLGLRGDGMYSLNVPFGTALKGSVVNNATVKVILPEGATDISFSGIDDAESYFSVRHTYLDTSGRPVLVVSKTNLVRDNDRDLVVTYRFPAMAIYHELMLPVIAFFALFVFFIVAGRFHLSIGESGKKSLALKEHALDLSGKLHTVVSGLKKLSSSSDAKAVQAAFASFKKSAASFELDIASRVTSLGQTVDEALASHAKVDTAKDRDARSAHQKKQKDAVADAVAKAESLERDITSKL